MSFTFSVAAPDPPDYGAVLDGLGLPDVRPAADEDHPEDGPWPEGVLHFHRPGLSSRGAEVSYGNGVFGARITTLASPEDYDLAMRFAEVVAGLTGHPVEPEDGDPVPAGELRSRYGPDWVRGQIEFGAGAVRAMVRGDEYQFLTLGGSVRPFHLGPRLLAELEAAGPEDGFAERLVDAIRRVQNVDAEAYFCANMMTARQPDGTEFTATALGPDVAYVLPNVDRLAVLGGDGDPDLLLVPYDALPDLLPAGRWRWLDERQVVVEAVPPDEWPEVRRRARGVAIEALPARSEGRPGKEKNRKDRGR